MLVSDLQKLQVLGLITLYELDATKLGAGIMRWHGHDGFEDWQIIESLAGEVNSQAGDVTHNAGASVERENYSIKRDIIWQGQTYSAIPIKTSGLEIRGDGRASTPTLSLASDMNNIKGFLRILCLQFNDFAGATLKVTQTSVKFLDAANFVAGNPSAANESFEQIWYVEQKVSENDSVINFELSNPVDFAGATIPSREITSYCDWCVKGDYRGEECGYTGAAMFTDEGLPTDNPELDRCGGRVSDCEIRFGKGNTLRHGGFPSSNFRV